jgi:hypothetical protein
LKAIERTVRTRINRRFDAAGGGVWLEKEEGAEALWRRGPIQPYSSASIINSVSVRSRVVAMRTRCMTPMFCSPRSIAPT